MTTGCAKDRLVGRHGLRHGQGHPGAWLGFDELLAGRGAAGGGLLQGCHGAATRHRMEPWALTTQEAIRVDEGK